MCNENKGEWKLWVAVTRASFSDDRKTKDEKQTSNSTLSASKLTVREGERKRERGLER